MEFEGIKEFINQVSNTKFIERIIDEVDKNGHGFVPFIGSGISQPSGIMIGSELSRYLSYVICMKIRHYCAPDAKSLARFTSDDQ